MPQKSPEDAINRVVKFASQAMENKQFCILVSLDISGAFNCAWWHKILYQLKMKKCPNNLYLLTRSYFKNREAKRLAVLEFLTFNLVDILYDFI